MTSERHVQSLACTMMTKSSGVHPSSMPLTQFAKPLLDTVDGKHGNELLQPRLCIESGDLFFV
jgi:hypothetical protein